MGSVSHMSFAMVREPLRPTRLRKCYEEQLAKTRNAPLSMMEQALQRSQSSPIVASDGLAPADAPSSASDVKSMNSRWYPRIEGQRGSLKLSGPAAMLAGVDPQKDKGHECPFW